MLGLNQRREARIKRGRLNIFRIIYPVAIISRHVRVNSVSRRGNILRDFSATN